MNDIKELLSNISKKVTEHENQVKASGQSYNIFEVLDRETDENKTHSAFIKSMIDPEVGHGFEELFIKKFIEVLKTAIPGNTILENFQTGEIDVLTEFFVGSVDNENKTGGRLDIVITDSNRKNLIIENKINAGDQLCQIERYCKYDTENSLVIYLSLFGDHPDEKSAGNLIPGRNFHCISYSKHILQWLVQCLDIVQDIPTLREIINQYIILVRKLTNQHSCSKMSKEIRELIRGNLKGAKQVVDHYDSFVNEIKDNFRIKVREEIEQTNLIVCEWNNSIEKINSNVFIDTKHNHVKIIIESFSGKGRQNTLSVGVWINQGKLSKMQKLKLKSFVSEKSLYYSSWWLSKESLKIDLNDLDLVSDLYNNDFATQKAKEVVTKVKSYIDRHQSEIDHICGIL